MTINILGQDYDFQEISAKEDTRLADNDGYHDGYAKLIRVNNDYNENHPSSIRDIPMYRKRVTRHEVIHAFFEESGVTKWRDDEALVNWISLQFPKMLKVFQQAGGL